MRDPGGFALGLLLTALAGWVDGVGFLEFAGLYPSFMSGNTIQLGIGLAVADPGRVLHAAGAVATFAVGAFAGGLLFATGSRWVFTIGLLIEAGALSLALLLVTNTVPAAPAAVLPIAFTMGLQNHVVSKGRPDNAGTTFITGTLFRFGDGLARLVAGTEQPGLVLRLLLVLITFLAGATGGALGAFRYGAVALSLPAALALILALTALLAEVVRIIRHRSDKTSQQRRTGRAFRSR